MLKFSDQGSKENPLRLYSGDCLYFEHQGVICPMLVQVFKADWSRDGHLGCLIVHLKELGSHYDPVD